MNRLVRILLVDYLWRTLGLWPMLGLAYLIQITSFWAGHVERWPLLGAVVACLAFFGTSDSPQTVLRTLPLSRAEAALFRWWASIGVPSLFVLACTVLSWFVSDKWPRASLSETILFVATAWSVVAWLAVLPLPVLRPERANRTTFAFVWGALVGAAFYGLPLRGLSREVLIAFAATGIALSILAYLRAAFGRTTAIVITKTPSRVAEQRDTRALQLHGWSVIVADITRTTVVLTVVTLVAATLVRWAYPILDTRVPLSWIFVSAVAIGACVSTRRWMSAITSMRVLPISDRRLALILFGILAAPGAVACFVATAVWHLSPRWGIYVPYYMLVAFLIAPLTLVPWQRNRLSASPTVESIQQWSPVLQQIVWPGWAGSVAAIGASRLLPVWSLTVLVITAAGLLLAGYFVLLSGIRSASVGELYGVR